MRYAILFTAYYWDDFVARQYAHLRARASNHNIFVIVDESAGSLGKIRARNLIRTSQRDIQQRCGLPSLVPDNVKRNPLWWNLDYLTYRFFDEHPEYDYCLTLDYDTRVNLDIDKLFVNIAASGCDFVARPVPGKIADWAWRKEHESIYPLSELRASLLSAMVISRQATEYLAARRRDDAADYQLGPASAPVTAWPFCEAFMPVELARGRFKMADLADFAETKRLGWHRIWCERDRAGCAAPGFVHPVVAHDRYVQELLRRYQPVSDIFDFKSALWREVRKYPLTLYLRPVIEHAVRYATLTALKILSRFKSMDKYRLRQTFAKF